MGIVIGAVAVVFVLALIIFPGVRGKLKVLVGGFLNIFVEDIAKTPEGAKAVFQQAIEEVQERYNKAGDTLNRFVGEQSSVQKNLNKLEEAYAIMDEFVSIANTLDGAIIQVEGNINARNYSDSGQALSAERAKAVAKYFIACGIDPNRLITVGNGNTKMVADPGSADAYLNRRTDVFFKIIEE